MIAIGARDLDEDSSNRLKGIQNVVDQLPDYAAKVEYAKTSWKNKPSNLFDGVKTLLAAMCNGNRRCVYCEDSLADEIEHMRPKDLFPEQAYAWNNYVLACGPCNGPKNNQFAILSGQLDLIDITRKRGAPVVEPPAGAYALVDPRIEDPVDFLWLDFRTWRYVPNTDDANSDIGVRAEYTIDVLRLNKRDDLVRGRKSAFSGYESRLRTWLEQREQWNDQQKASFIEDFRAERFRGVWERMKRYRHDVEFLAGVAQLIGTAPEVMDW